MSLAETPYLQYWTSKLSCFCFVLFWVWLFETASCYIAQASLKLMSSCLSPLSARITLCQSTFSCLFFFFAPEYQVHSSVCSESALDLFPSTLCSKFAHFKFFKVFRLFFLHEMGSFSKPFDPRQMEGDDPADCIGFLPYSQVCLWTPQWQILYHCDNQSKWSFLKIGRCPSPTPAFMWSLQRAGIVPILVISFVLKFIFYTESTAQTGPLAHSKSLAGKRLTFRPAQTSALPYHSLEGRHLQHFWS